MFTKKLIFVLAMSTASVLGACSKGGGGGGDGDKLGVPECDAYLDKMAACAKKSDKTTGEQLTKMRDMMAGAWKDSVKDAAQKAEMPKMCTTAIADMKKQFPTCDW
jgi:hypothetical protein